MKIFYQNQWGKTNLFLKENCELSDLIWTICYQVGQSYLNLFLKCKMDNLLSVCKFHKYWIIFLLHVIFFANRILLRDIYFFLINFTRRFIIPLFVYVWFFSGVCFQMFPQNVWTGRFKVTLIVFVWLSSGVYSLCPQISHTEWIFVSFSNVCF